MEAIQSYLFNISSTLKPGTYLEKLKDETPRRPATRLKAPSGARGVPRRALRALGCFARNVIYLTKSKNRYASFSEATAFNYVLIIKSKDFINNILIPYLDSLTFHSKKELDYLD